MAGEIQLNGTSFASESGGTITVNNGTLGSSVVFPAGTIIKIYGPVFNNSTSIVSKSSTSFGEIHSSYRITVNNMISSTNLLIFEYQADWGSLNNANHTTEISIGESSDYTTPYSGFKSYHSAVSTNHGTTSTYTNAGVYNYYSTGGGTDVRNNKFFSLGHSGSKTFSPIYRSVHGSAIRGSSSAVNGQSEFFIIYEVQQ